MGREQIQIRNKVLKWILSCTGLTVEFFPAVWPGHFMDETQVEDELHLTPDVLKLLSFGSGSILTEQSWLHKQKKMRKNIANLSQRNRFA